MLLTILGLTIKLRTVLAIFIAFGMVIIIAKNGKGWKKVMPSGGGYWYTKPNLRARFMFQSLNSPKMHIPVFVTD
jgi:hypothetical protein